jgi:hypothetical protein
MTQVIFEVPLRLPPVLSLSLKVVARAIHPSYKERKVFPLSFGSIRFYFFREPWPSPNLGSAPALAVFAAARYFQGAYCVWKL